MRVKQVQQEPKKEEPARFLEFFIILNENLCKTLRSESKISWQHGAHKHV